MPARTLANAGDAIVHVQQRVVHLAIFCTDGGEYPLNCHSYAPGAVPGSTCCTSPNGICMNRVPRVPNVSGSPEHANA